nr:MAG: lipase family protein [Gammaproteobacteria bacterium]
MLISTCFPLSASETGSVDFIEIHNQAGFARAAYDAEAKIRAFLESSNYTLTLYNTAPDIQISYFLATNKQTETQVISVRGTSNIENAMVDILLKLRVDQNTGIQLHEGFAFAARQVYAELKPLLKADYKIRTTGHSLGGAVALVLAMYLDADQYNIDQVITFGQPKVTNLAGANKISHLNIIRVVTPRDIVPLVPPLDPLDIKNLEVYWHAGKEVILLDENQYAVLAGLDSMLRATKFTQQPFNQRYIENHNMSVYISMIRAKTKSSRLVPYKYDLNLFNLLGNE